MGLYGAGSASWGAAAEPEVAVERVPADQCPTPRQGRVRLSHDAPRPGAGSGVVTFVNPLTPHATRGNNAYVSDDWKRQLERAAAELLRRDNPVALVREVDALDASTRYPYVWPRGPVFGVAALGPEPDARWRLVSEATDGTPQEARDALNSLLWFQAKDEAGTVPERRELLAAVHLLECERIDELTVLGTRYRVVRGDKYAHCGLTEGPEPPRPTDPEPADRSRHTTCPATPGPCPTSTTPSMP